MVLIVACCNYYKSSLHETILLAIIKAFPYGYFYRDKEYPLSPSMIIALKKVSASQKKRKPFGPKDLKRSLYPLIERGLISLTYYSMHDEKKATWGVTKKGIRNLQSIARGPSVK